MTNRGVGRPPKKALPGATTTLTLRLDANVKNAIVDIADGFGMSLTGLIIYWLEKEMGRSVEEEGDE